MDPVEHRLPNREPHGADYSTVGNKKVGDIHMVQHTYVGAGGRSTGEQRLDIFPVDLDVAPSAAHVTAFFILQDDEPEIL